jgi:hypothetical protein
MGANPGTFVGLQSLPQQFVESVRAGMRLPQPTPQFFFAMAALSAMLRTSAIAEGAGTAENFVRLMAGPGNPVPPTLDAYARTADAFPGMVQAVQGFGVGAGDTVKMRRPVYSTGGLSKDARRVNPSVATSLQGQSITMEEVPVVLEQYEGPWDPKANSGSGGVGPYQVNDFDARFRRSADNLAGEVANHLSYDYVAWLDAVIRDLFRATPYITYADGVSNVLSFVANGGHYIDLAAVLAGRKALSDRERKPFDNGKYTMIVPTAWNTQMTEDPKYRQMAATPASTEKNTLFRYLATVEDVQIFESTTVKTYAAGDTVPGDGNAVPTGATVYEALLFGPEAVGMGQAEPPTMHTTSDTDFGKNVKVIWRSIEAFQTLDVRGVQRILFQA